MKQTFDTDSILFGILKGNTELEGVISGGIYIRQRPDNSIKEDIVVNTIDLTQEYAPQIGTSNINIHCLDMPVIIEGTQQKKANLARLRSISELVLGIVRAVKIDGLTFTPSNQTLIQEAEINQHYVNIRINWNIH